MASSRNSLPEHVAAVLSRHVRPGDRLLLALSGGVDSVVLLDVLDRLRGPFEFALSALHVNHGLSRNAPRWAEFCRSLAASRAIPLEVVTVEVRRGPGQSLEAAARAARYQAYGAQAVEYVVLAHNLDDQAETLLLQLLRGAGLKGLSAMPEIRAQKTGDRRQRDTGSLVGGPQLLRPLLAVPRSAILEYARSRSLVWVEDESNASLAYDRNYLRHAVLPLIEQRFPAYRQTLARTASHLAEAALALAELAEDDARGAVRDGCLDLAAWGKLSLARQKNLLRHYLACQGAPLPSAARLEEILRQLSSARPDARIAIRIGGFELRRFKGHGVVRPAGRAEGQDLCLPWRGEKRVPLGAAGGTLVFHPSLGQGISLKALTREPATIRFRQGGERIQPDCRRRRRSLKNLLQEGNIPPWERSKLPLLFSGERLVWVAGIGIDCAYQAREGEASVEVEWEKGE